MNRNGFTLIEMTIALLLVGILLAIGVPLVGTMVKMAKNAESREAVRTAREGLKGTIVKNGAFAAVAPLETSSPKTVDAWNKKLLFLADDSLWGSGKDVCGVTSTKTRLKECGDESCGTYSIKENIAFIVYSNGEDADGVCTGTGVCSDGSGSCVFPTCTGTCINGTCNGGMGSCSTCTASCTFPVWQDGAGYNSPCSYTATNPAMRYDDIVQYVTLDEVRAARNCSFSIVRTSLPEARVGSGYSAPLQAFGDGSTSYVWSTGQAQGGCPAGSVQLVAAATGLCLNTSTGVIAGTPVSAAVGLHSFTVTAKNANDSTASQAFGITIADRYFQSGVLLVNAVPATTLYVQRNGGTCISTTGLNVMVYPGDTITLFSQATCAYGSRRCPTPALTYDYVKSLDSNDNADVGLTNVPNNTGACTFNGGSPY
jgi:prepilin-type N-terminal cleavage/methylation domain-containing protein